MPKKILIINEDESLREIFQMYLELKKYEVYEAPTGSIGLEKANQILPDLILLDVRLPDINGYEVCRKLKQNPATTDIPVLFLSSLLETSEKIKGLESGGLDFINNATDYAEILARIETHLKIKELNDALKASNQELMIKQKALNEDLQAAAFIQQSLLPLNRTKIENLEVSWLCQPCELVGGDICSINQTNHESSAFYVLDVSGHGVPSAMVTVSITQFLQQLYQTSISPKHALSVLNRNYPFEKFSMFSTIFYMTFNSQKGKLTYSSAGHPPGIHLSKEKPLQLLTGNGPVIGIDTDYQYEEYERTLQTGDKVILYTDGIIEFCNSSGEQYGSERFYELLEEQKSHSVEEIIRLVGNSLKEFGKGNAPQDDISILAIEFKK